MVVRELITLMGFKVNQGQLNRARGQIRMATNDMADMGRKLTMYLTLPLALAAKGMVTAASNMERLEISFKVMLGSAEKSRNFIKDLFAFAKESPLFTIGDIGAQAKGMLAAGFSQEEVIPGLKMLGDIAAGAGVELHRVVQNYSQVRAATKLTGHELKDFTRAGIPLLATLSELRFGTKKSTGAIRDLMRQGKISFEEVEKAFKVMTSAGGLFYNLSKEMSKTLFGRFQKLLDMVLELAIAYGKKLAPAMHKVITLGERTVGMLKGLNNDTLRFTLVIGALLAALGPGMLIIKAIGVLLGVLSVKVVAIATAVALVVDDIIVWFKGGRSVLGLLVGDVENAKKRVLPFLNIAKGLLMQVVGILERLAIIAVQLGSWLWGMFGGVLTSFFSKSFGRLKEVLVDIAGQIKLLLAGISLLLDGIIEKDGSKVKDGLVEIFWALYEIAKLIVVDLFGYVLEQAWILIKEIASTILQEIGGAIKKLFGLDGRMTVKASLNPLDGLVEPLGLDKTKIDFKNPLVPLMDYIRNSFNMKEHGFFGTGVANPERVSNAIDKSRKTNNVTNYVTIVSDTKNGATVAKDFIDTLLNSYGGSNQESSTPYSLVVGAK